MKLNHVERLQKGLCKIDNGFVFNDIITFFERASDHCSNIAVAMIELQSGEFDTHEYLLRVKSKRSEAFNRYYDEYKERFPL